MKLSGQQRKQLKYALISAFPNKSNLEQLVYEEFEKNLNAIAMGNDLKDIVFKLIQAAEAGGWVDKLVEKSYNYNSGNPELKEFREQYFSISNLYDILKPLEQKLISQIKQAYLACRKKGYEDWETAADTLEQILTNLKDMPEANTSDNPIVKFLVKFLENATIPEPTAKKLKKWLEQYANKTSDLSKQRINGNLNPEENNKDIPTYLIFSLQPNQQKKNWYNVRAYFIPNGNKGKFNCSTGEGCPSLELINQSPVSLKKANNLLEKYINLSKKYMQDYCNQPMILFFLPRKLLLKEPIDCWSYKARTIGSVFHVVLRCRQRLKNDYLNRNDWIKKWEKLHLQEALNFISIDCETLNKELKKPDSVGLKSLQVLSEKNIDDLDATATPVAIWLRKIPNDVNCQGEIDELVNGEITQLPSLVTEKRAEALDITDRDNHIGSHISLLWEDPYLFPPLIEYTIPS